MTYQESVAYLEALAPRGWRLGLDRMTEFARRAGLSDNLGNGQTKYIHITGTNGKGSVTAYVQSILFEAGYRTGAFFSPFVYDLRERVQFGRELIPKEDFARIATELRPVAESFSEADFGGITEFELKTAIGFRYWTEMKCEYVALEVGLGGRLDSTNIVDPACSVIVSIGLDHTAILGETLELIATEKAGIIKPGKPVIAGSMPQEALGVIEEIAQERQSPLLRFGKEFGPCDFEPGIEGYFQTHNLSLAVAAIDAAGISVREGDLRKASANARAPGRFERRTYKGREVILDGAHNADAARALAISLRQSAGETFGKRDAREEARAPKYVLVTGMVAGHDPVTFFGPLQELVARAFVAPIDFHRAVNPVDLCGAVSDTIGHFEPTESIAEALERAHETGLPIVVTGSFYLVGAVGNFIQENAESES